MPHNKFQCLTQNIPSSYLGLCMRPAGAIIRPDWHDPANEA